MYCYTPTRSCNLYHIHALFRPPEQEVVSAVDPGVLSEGVFLITPVTLNHWMALAILMPPKLKLVLWNRFIPRKLDLGFWRKCRISFWQISWCKKDSVHLPKPIRAPFCSTNYDPPWVQVISRLWNKNSTHGEEIETITISFSSFSSLDFHILLKIFKYKLVKRICFTLHTLK